MKNDILLTMVLKNILVTDESSEFGIMHYRATVEFAQILVRSLLLLNGGAIVAILTFVGNSQTDSSPIHIKFELLTSSIGFYLTGVGLALLGTGFAYVSMVIQRGRLGERYSRYLFAICWIVGMLSLCGSFIGFAFGSLDAIASFPV